MDIESWEVYPIRSSIERIFPKSELQRGPGQMYPLWYFYKRILIVNLKWYPTNAMNIVEYKNINIGIIDINKKWTWLFISKNINSKPSWKNE